MLVRFGSVLLLHRKRPGAQTKTETFGTKLPPVARFAVNLFAVFGHSRRVERFSARGAPHTALVPVDAIGHHFFGIINSVIASRTTVVSCFEILRKTLNGLGWRNWIR